MAQRTIYALFSSAILYGFLFLRGEKPLHVQYEHFSRAGSSFDTAFSVYKNGRLQLETTFRSSFFVHYIVYEAQTKAMMVDSIRDVTLSLDVPPYRRKILKRERDFISSKMWFQEADTLVRSHYMDFDLDGR